MPVEPLPELIGAERFLAVSLDEERLELISSEVLQVDALVRREMQLPRRTRLLQARDSVVEKLRRG